MRKFSMNEELILTETESGMQLQMVNDDAPDETTSWIEGWYDLPNGNCLNQTFIVLETGEPTYHLINEALVFWGKQVLNATLNSTQMSPEFSNRYLFPAIIQTRQARWN
ncbi:MAG: hypothetical protein ACXVJB_00260 [Mucilaginibacter sp.]